MILSSAPLKRLYAQLNPTFGTVVNSSGTWTPTTAKLIPHNSINIKRLVDLIKADWKTGTASNLTGTPGRVSASFSGEVPLMPSGAAGTAPNVDAILANIFNGTATLVASTSATYNFVDGVLNPLTLAHFNEASSSHQQQFLHSGIIQNFTINLGGGGFVNLSFDGVAFACLEKDYFSSDDSTAKGGLTTFPAEPASPALVGNQLGAFTASVSFGGTAVAEFVSAQLSGSTGRTIRFDGVGRYATGVVQGRRSIGLRSLKFADSDGAGLIAVKNAAATKTAMDVIVTQGTTAGYIMTHTLKSVQFGGDGFSISENGSGVDVDFGEAEAHASALASTNDYVLQLT
ncbi:MAG: hypothetical protein JWN34_2254 [Bryobacterales bacterium]|nr:hypothetical protein [Bryobacterales bacterium]